MTSDDDLKDFLKKKWLTNNFVSKNFVLGFAYVLLAGLFLLNWMSCWLVVCFCDVDCWYEGNDIDDD